MAGQRIFFFPALFPALVLCLFSNLAAAESGALEEVAKQAGAYGASLVGDAA